ncbi:MAG: diadenylate cyclase CdaA [Clostridia bacterium]|nr:diadenylate cyclase CdaA [Clostridia bacterium]
MIRSFAVLAGANPVQVMTTIADILIVAFIIYKVMRLFKGTQAVSLIQGLAMLVAAYAAAEYLRFDALFWLLRQVTTMTLVGVPIVFQPELRRGLERLGRGRLLGSAMRVLGPDERRRVLAEVSRAAELMSREYTGALIILERETGVGDLLDTGISLDAQVSAELLMNIFTPNTPLHDGAVVIRGNRIVAAACLLPLSERQAYGKKLGTRHRAALGLSERTDAVAVVVSEETGAVSIASEGELVRGLAPGALQERLFEVFDVNHKETKFWKPKGAHKP